MNIEAIDPSVLEEVSGGIDWNQVGMQALYGGAAGAAVGSAVPGVGSTAGAIGGAVVGGGLAAWSTWNQSTMQPAR